MFEKSAHFYDLIYANKDYAGESAKVHHLIQQYQRTPGRRLLDVACGTGGHIDHLRSHYDVMGLDLDEGMLAVARQRFPNVTFYQANMQDFDLGQSFDAITCLFSAISYTCTTEALQQTLQVFARHLNPGGVVLAEGFIHPGAFRPNHIGSIFVDEPELKIARMNRIELVGIVAVIDFHYLVGTLDDIQYFTEHHELALFSDDDFRAAFEQAGLHVTILNGALRPDFSLVIGQKP